MVVVAVVAFVVAAFVVVVVGMPMYSLLLMYLHQRVTWKVQV